VSRHRPILLFGRSGQIGDALYERLAARHDVVAPDRASVDLNSETAVREAVSQHQPWLVLNAAAYTAVDAAESDEAAAHRVNAVAPGAMAAAAHAIGAAIVHFSTDYVFDGTSATPYVESDAPAPLGAYGRTKLAGERAVRQSGAPHLIFRASWVYAPRGRNFLLAILRRARETGQLRVVGDQTGAPTSAAAIAAAVVTILERTASPNDISAHSGVYHMTARGSTTWFDFARAILDGAGVGANVESISTHEFGAAAARPRYSLLDNTKLQTTFGLELPDWRVQLADVLRELGLAAT